MKNEIRQSSTSPFLFTLCFLLVTIALIASSPSSAREALPISSGTWEGVTPCVGGSAGLYPVKMEISAQSDRGTLLLTYEPDKVYRQKFDKRKYSIRRSKESGGPKFSYSYVDEKGLNSKNIIFIKGPTTTYIWTGTPSFFSMKCQEAILVRYNEELFPRLPTWRDFCYRVQTWSNNASYAKQEIKRVSARIRIPGYDQGLALFGSQFSDATFQKFFDRKYSTFSDDDLRKFLYALRDCGRYATGAGSLSDYLQWIFPKEEIQKWKRRYPLSVNMNYARQYYQYYAFEEPISSSLETERLSLLREIRDISASTRSIEDALDSLFLLPESPELESSISAFLSKYSRPLMFVDVQYATEVLDLVAARQEMLRASEALASQFRLSEYPKLPPPNQSVEDHLIDDALLKPLTDAEIRELEQSIERDF